MMKKAWSTRPVNRDRKKEAFWRKVIAGRRGSGLSIRAWCLKHTLRESSFFWWRRELARRDGQARTWAHEPHRRLPPNHPHAPSLAAVRVTPDFLGEDPMDPSPQNGSRGCIEILWPDQRRVRVVGPVDRQALADVLAVMRETILMNSTSATFRAPEAW